MNPSTPAFAAPGPAGGIDFQGSQYGPPITVGYGRNKVAGNCVWYGDFKATANQQQGGGKGGGGGTVTSYTYSASFLLALSAGAIVGCNNVYQGSSIVTLASTGGVLLLGTTSQSPWSGLPAGHDLNYRRTALYGVSNFDLGGNPSLPNFNFELDMLQQNYTSHGVFDASPSDIATDIATSADHGVNFPFLGSFTQWSNYCVANGIFFSPVYDQQQTAAEVFQDLLKYSNSEGFYSEGVVKVVPRGDTSVTGNGVTFNPVSTIVTQVDYRQLITNGVAPPLKVPRKSPADCMNMIRVTFKDRANTYHPGMVAAQLDYDILVNGQRAEQDEQVDMITTAGVAKLVAQNLLQKEFFVRNSYEGKLPYNYCYLEPMDLIEVSDSNIGLVNWPVRILTIEEDEAGLLSFTAEEYPEGVGYAVMFPSEPNAGANIDPLVDPGAVVAPYILRGPGFVVPEGEAEMWIAVTGLNTYWAGAAVYLSLDGVNYTAQGQVARQAKYGLMVLETWTASTVKQLGMLLNDGAGNTWRVVSVSSDQKTGGSAPSWGTPAVGTLVTDNHVVWICAAVPFTTPTAPVLTDIAGGALAGATYFVRCTWVDAFGRESTASIQTSRAVAISRLLQVAIPAGTPPAGTVAWNVYVSTTTNAEVLQTTGSNLPLATTSWGLPTTGLTAGVVVPSTNNTGLFSMLPQQGDPDTFSTPTVALYKGQIVGGTQADADNLVTLSMVDTELFSYETSTLQADGSYALSYMRRAAYGSTSVGHIPNSPFVRLDQQVVRIPIDPSLIGSTVYFKFQSYNCFSKTPRTLASETAYPYVVGSNQEVPDVPAQVQSITARAATDHVAISWVNSNNVAVGRTSIEYAPRWNPFNNYALNTLQLDPNGNTWKCTTAGVSGNFPEPSWPTSGTVGTTTVTDNTVVWTLAAFGAIPIVGLGTPPTPLFYATPGGIIGTNQFWFQITFIDQYGRESAPSAEFTFTAGAGNNHTIQLAGQPPVGAVAWNLYGVNSAHGGSGHEKIQTNYQNMPITQSLVHFTNYAEGAATPPTSDATAQGTFQVLRNVAGGHNGYKATQDGDQEYFYRLRQLGLIKQAGYGPYSPIGFAANAGKTRQNSNLGSANLLLDPNFLRTRSSGDETYWNQPNGNYTVNMTASEDGAQCGQIAAASYGVGPYMNAQEYNPCKVGDTFYTRVRCRTAAALTAGQFVFGVQFYDQGLGVLSTSENILDVSSTLGTTWRNFGFYTQAPAGAHFCRFVVRGGNSGGALNTIVRFTKCFMTLQDFAYGSTPSTGCNTTLSYSSTTTSVTISWSGFHINLPDGTSQNVSNGSIAVSGLSASHNYFAYPYLSISNQNVGLPGNGNVGSPAWLFTSTNVSGLAWQNNLNNVPMSTGAFQVSTPASGSGGGTGGGSGGGTGGCLHGDDLMRVLDPGGEPIYIHARELRDGMRVWTGEVMAWQPVAEVEHLEDSTFLELTLSNGQLMRRTAAHRLYDMKGQEVRCDALRLGDLLQGEDSRVRVLGLRLREEVAPKVTFSVIGHRFYADDDGVEEHNTNQKP